MAKRLKRTARKQQQRVSLPAPRWQKIATAAFLLLMATLVATDYYLRHDRPAMAVATLPARPKFREVTPAERLRLAIDRILAEAGVQLQWFSERENLLRVSLPAEISPATLARQIAQRVQQLGARVTSLQETLPAGGAEVVYSAPNIPPYRILLVPQPVTSPQPMRRSGKIALIIDDFGYQNQQAVAGFINLPFPITYAVIPGLPHSEAIARYLHRRGKAVIIHMPMEALERPVERNGYELLVDLPEKEIRRRVRQALRAVPHAEGMNNHMGSRATTNQKLLTALFAELKNTGLFFIDSRTNNASRAFALAGQSGIATALNDTFLDNIEDVTHIAQKLALLADLAAQHGHAIGIGHPYPATLQVLREMVPQLQKQGLEFVPVRLLVQEQAGPTANLTMQQTLRRK
ncbi:MAG: divergent polysaccharide deacetylase family protein [candidate division KSB1 bacterium]|nr:divergent polysaccharide deacetylase family protein [candidate division KSB1 bacterium]MDZ7274021.1 divergent polysaccharide deacetylase family protein [candidate division KSB1 bacterium]MDZ7286394.1 divergent polysaccharide deacetylase family protein [candidate division KSB1 bacterium]MDZ7296622.1 divergent polysaccharide deacetylase family protein [candidate division KSB1 bacterium]MDZ7306844.1 divergent polysaccharide deacetylase family protein [candidate division KSB1 bacterium]